MDEMVEALLHSFEMWFHNARETGSVWQDCITAPKQNTWLFHVIKLILRLCGAGLNPANGSFIWQLILQFHRPWICSEGSCNTSYKLQLEPIVYNLLGEGRGGSTSLLCTIKSFPIGNSASSKKHSRGASPRSNPGKAILNMLKMEHQRSSTNSKQESPESAPDDSSFNSFCRISQKWILSLFTASQQFLLWPAEFLSWETWHSKSSSVIHPVLQDWIF